MSDCNHEDPITHIARMLIEKIFGQANGLCEEFLAGIIKTLLHRTGVLAFGSVNRYRVPSAA